jgi:hypothetical protein
VTFQLFQVSEAPAEQWESVITTDDGLRVFRTLFFGERPKERAMQYDSMMRAELRISDGMSTVEVLRGQDMRDFHTWLAARRDVPGLQEALRLIDSIAIAAMRDPEYRWLNHFQEIHRIVGEADARR